MLYFANKWKSRSVDLLIMSFTYSRNRNGPSTVLCVTPPKTCCRPDSVMR